MFQCGKARCKICQFIEPGSTFVVLLRNILSVLITILTVIHKVLFTLLVVKSAENSMWAAL